MISNSVALLLPSSDPSHNAPLPTVLEDYRSTGMPRRIRTRALRVPLHLSERVLPESLCGVNGWARCDGRRSRRDRRAPTFAPSYSKIALATLRPIEIVNQDDLHR